MKNIFFLVFLSGIVFAHPVAYNINLILEYDDIKKQAKIICKSDSRNKCGLHNFDLLKENGDIITSARFPFLKKNVTISCDKEPFQMKFFLRKIPEHFYTVYTKK